MATINANVTVEYDAWVDLHDEIGADLGTALLIQDRLYNSPGKIRYIDSATEPTGDAFTAEGGYLTKVPREQVESSPDAGERTWARRSDDDSGVVLVQTL